MPDTKATQECSSEKSVPADIENDVSLPAADADSLRPEKPKEATTISGDRALVLMDLENGLVGWENDKDPENPQ
jgi:hypothetical protein